MEHSFKVRKEEKEEKTNDVMNHEIDLYKGEDGDMVLYCYTHNMYLVSIYDDNEIVIHGDSCICGKETVIPMDDSYTKIGDE